mmetsp:Transcript_7502/g.14208  ORF Transcript_7502/g.14208 Transcript_7502/m.14208 type:complete len:94 (+) Transcript_7502:266-547(+)
MTCSDIEKKVCNRVVFVPPQRTSLSSQDILGEIGGGIFTTEEMKEVLGVRLFAFWKWQHSFCFLWLVQPFVSCQICLLHSESFLLWLLLLSRA